MDSSDSSDDEAALDMGADDFFDLMEEELQPDQSKPADSPTDRTIWMHPSVQVAPVSAKGRGLVTLAPIAAGTVVLRETAAASAPVTAADAIEQSACLVVALIRAGRSALCDGLEPQMCEFATHPMRKKLFDTLVHGAGLVQVKLSGDSLPVLSTEEVERLLLVVILNAHSVRTRSGPRQGLFPLAAMGNHACWPNLMFEGEIRDDSEPNIVFRTIVDTEIGSELCISYIGPSFTSFAERSEQLQLGYGFMAEGLSTDPLLELTNTEALSPEVAEAQLQQVFAANSGADVSWEKLGSAGCTGGTRDLNRRTAIKEYRAVIQVSLLGTCHAWRYNATLRLAMLLNEIGTAEGFEEALPLWQALLEAGELVWPSPLWPEQVALLRGAKTAASGLGISKCVEEYDAKLRFLDSKLELTMGIK